MRMYETLVSQQTIPSSTYVLRTTRKAEWTSPYIPTGPPYFEDHTYRRLAYSAYFEESVDNEAGSHHSWKSYEHYKRSQGDAIERSDKMIHEGTSGGGAGSTWGWTEDLTYGFPSDSTGFGVLGKFDLNLPSFYTKRADGGFVPTPANIETLKQMSLQTMLPGIKAELSLVNSLIELKDFRTLPKMLREMSSFAVKRGKTIRETLRATSSGYLQVKFNILPLLSDIAGLRSALSRFERRLNDLVARQGRVQRRHYAFNWYEFAAAKEDVKPLGAITASNSWLGSPTFGQRTLRRLTYSEPTTFHAEIEYNYNFTQYQLEHARVLALLDSLGANLNPAILWNAIPWSFVVDWVLGVSRWLNQFAVANMKPVTNIRRYLWSVTRSRRILVSSKIGTRYTLTSGPPPTEGPVALVHESSYRRDVGYPSISSITSSGLNSTEFTLGAALVLSQRRRRTRRS